eukprot:TRINITY_DN160_c0_g1_i3.p1 TRINITY_DN160_c0_g1~~TRINITY_DN160_c0_g1_i3.p1  ORF type:complete len:228 (-),score=49.63 TRINITY_DN160_c0_g1_i3:61-744(-)
MDLRSVEIKDVLDNLTCMSIPVNDHSRTKEGYPIMYARTLGYNPSKFGIKVLMAINFLTTEIIQSTVEDQQSGVFFIMDCSGMGWSNWDPSSEKIMTEAFTNAFPVRSKGMVMYNINWLFKVIYKIFKPWLSKKLQRRMHVVSVDELSQFYPEDTFEYPIEAGGDLDLYSEDILGPCFEAIEDCYNKYVGILNAYEGEHGSPPDDQIDGKKKNKKSKKKKKTKKTSP